MTRIRTDSVRGTLTDNPLLVGATTMNSAGLANLAAVSSAEALIILDPLRSAGAPEIVRVTAHTAAATSATITRGQFGTTARQHASGTLWVHGPIASNATTFVTAADSQGDFVPPNAWESWTPTFQNVTTTSGTITAAFARIGRTIHFRLKFVLGASSAVGTTPGFTLPVPAAAAYVDTVDVILSTVHYTDTGVAGYKGFLRKSSGDNVIFIAENSAGTYAAEAGLTATIPFTWGSGDSFAATGTYEAAS